jgi:hypothetical protein
MHPVYAPPLSSTVPALERSHSMPRCGSGAAVESVSCSTDTDQRLKALALARSAPRCGARARTRGGAPCQAPAIANGRCRMHGGKSPGPGRWENHHSFRTGEYTIEAIAYRRRYAETVRTGRALIAQVRAMSREQRMRFRVLYWQNRHRLHTGPPL